MVTAALRHARSRGVRDMVIDITQMSGFETPGPAYRRWVVRRWARASDAAVRVAVIVRPEHICPQKTGLLVAAEQGLQAHICDSEAEAIDWLDAQGTVRAAASRAARGGEASATRT
jgi:hypothetical protein